ncbi:MAG: copper transporter [Clostridia bacterium]|nr:copper transporter [Clostridia bacterium]
MKCTKCNSDMPDGVAFCRACGAKMDVSASGDNIERMFAAAISDAAEHKIPVPHVSYQQSSYNGDDRGSASEPIKKKFNKLIIPIIIMGVVVVALAVALGIQIGAMGSKNDKISSYKSQVSGLEAEIDELEAAIDSAEAQIEEGKGEYEALESEKLEVESEKEDVQGEYDRFKMQHSDCGDALAFFNQHAVVLPDDDTGIYHKYGCPYLDTSYFWIFNSEYAKSEGYTSCSHCIG